MSAIVISRFKKTNLQNYSYTTNISRQSFELSTSIKSAALSSIYVSSYIIFFSALLGVIFLICNTDLSKIAFAVIFEIGNATAIISKSKNITNVLSFALTGFALGFSGISVFMQALAYLPSEISKKELLGYKLIQGALCGLFAALFYHICSSCFFIIPR